MQAIQMVVVSGAGFREDPPTTYYLDYDEPIYGGPLNKRPNDQSSHGLLKRVGLHGFTCVEYLRDTFYPTIGNPGTSGIEKQLVVVHYLRIRE
jgi:hypothetical protein